MSKMIPVKVEYLFSMKNHYMKAVAEHLESERQFSFYFDEKVVSEKIIPSGDFLTDDDCIRDMVENYCKDHTGIYADLFKRHSDKVHLVSKTIDYVIESFGINLETHVVVEKGKYHFEVNDNNGEDVFSGSRQKTFLKSLKRLEYLQVYWAKSAKNFRIISMNCLMIR